ncbi:hypothetical protein CHUAL_010657 [Chamberlinius hualienensis]
MQTIWAAIFFLLCGTASAFFGSVADNQTDVFSSTTTEKPINYFNIPYKYQNEQLTPQTTTKPWSFWSIFRFPSFSTPTTPPPTTTTNIDDGRQAFFQVAPFKQDNSTAIPTTDAPQTTKLLENLSGLQKRPLRIPHTAYNLFPNFFNETQTREISTAVPTTALPTTTKPKRKMIKLFTDTHGTEVWSSETKISQ